MRQITHAGSPADILALKILSGGKTVNDNYRHKTVRQMIREQRANAVPETDEERVAREQAEKER